MCSGSKSVNVAPTIEPWFSENWPSCRGYVCLQLFCIKHPHRLAQFNVASKHDRITSPTPQLNVPKIKANIFFPGNVSFWECIFGKIVVTDPLMSVQSVVGKGIKSCQRLPDNRIKLHLLPDEQSGSWMWLWIFLKKVPYLRRWTTKTVWGDTSWTPGR